MEETLPGQHLPTDKILRTLTVEIDPLSTEVTFSYR